MRRFLLALALALACAPGLRAQTPVPSVGTSTAIIGIGPFPPVINVLMPQPAGGCNAAKGDGKTDDTPAIQCMLNMTNPNPPGTGGGFFVVYFPSATYLVTGLVIPTNSIGLTLQGQGAGTSVIRMSAATGDVISATGAQLLTISGLQVESRIARTAGSCINFSGVNEWTLQDDRFIGCFNTITILASSNDGFITRSRILGGAAPTVLNRGVFVQNSQVITIKDFLCVLGTASLGGTNACIQLDSGTDGVGIEYFQSAPVPNGGSGPGGGRGLWLTNTLHTSPPVFTRCTDCYVEGGSGQANGVQVDSAIDFQYEGYIASSLIGLQITGGADIRFGPVTIFNNTQHGVLATGGDRLRFFHCSVANNSQQTNNTYSHFSLTNVTNVTIDHCMMGNFLPNGGSTNIAANGISLNGTVSGAILTDNTIDATKVTNPISGQGATTYQRGNRFALTSPGAMQGTATLVGGTVTVATTEVLATDKILVTVAGNAVAANVGIPRITTITGGTSFVITSTVAADTSRLNWEIAH